MATPLPLKITGLTVSFARSARPALNNVNIVVPGGTCCAILGATGSGRTMLFHAVSGLLGGLQPALTAYGSVNIGSDSYVPFPPHPLFPTVALLMQEPRLQVSGMTETVSEEVAWTLRNTGANDERARAGAELALSELGILHLGSRSLRALSGGEFHRVAMASVLVVHPSVLLLDEPAASLDQTALQALVRILRQLRGRTTCLLTDSDADLALRVADQIILLSEGSVRFAGTRADFLRRIEEFADGIPVQAWREARDRYPRLPDRVRSRFSQTFGGA